MPKPSTPSVWASGKSFAFQPSLEQQAQGFDYIATARPGTGAPITDDHDWPLNKVTDALKWVMDQIPDGGIDELINNKVPDASTTTKGVVELATSQEAISGAAGVIPDAAGVLASIQSNVNPGLGVGQSWQNVTSSRSVGVTYTNTTGRTIVVKVSAEAVSNYIYIQCTGSVESIQSAGRDSGVSVNSYAEIDIIVPPSGTYSVILGGLGGPYIRNWWELR